jgi:hypothetical protein
MGYLDSTSNNVLIDACVTDAGRQALARNDGSFAIHKFACSDDEVNYDIIKKYGRTVGREKIEKNTPVFEALTNTAQAQKYKLISVSNPNLLRLPSLSLSGDSTVNGSTMTITLGRNTQKTSSVTLEQIIQNESSIDVELRDQSFTIDLSNVFLQVLRNVPTNIDGQQRATYIVTRSPNENSYGGSIVQLTLSVKSLSDAMFQVYGTVADKNLINTYVNVTGLQSGATSTFKIVINKNL